MVKFLVRMGSLALIIILFGIGSYQLPGLLKANYFFTRHHGINLAYAGTLLAAVSLLYSLRKKHLIKIGSLRWWLGFHVLVGASSLLLVLGHGQYRYQAMLPGLLIILALVIGITGLFGWHLYLITFKNLLIEIRSMEEEEYFMARMASSAFRFWRFIHVLASLAALCLTISHGLSLIIFRGPF